MPAMRPTCLAQSPAALTTCSQVIVPLSVMTASHRQFAQVPRPWCVRNRRAALAGSGGIGMHRAGGIKIFTVGPHAAEQPFGGHDRVQLTCFFWRDEATIFDTDRLEDAIGGLSHSHRSGVPAMVSPPVMCRLICWPLSSSISCNRSILTLCSAAMFGSALRAWMSPAACQFEPR